MQRKKWRTREDSLRESFFRRIQRVYLRYVSQVSSCKKKKERGGGEERERENLRLFQYTFKSVIATSKEIDLGSAECCHQSIHFSPI